MPIPLHRPAAANLHAARKVVMILSLLPLLIITLPTNADDSRISEKNADANNADISMGGLLRKIHFLSENKKSIIKVTFKEAATAGQLYELDKKLDHKKANMSDFEGLKKDMQKLKTNVKESTWTLAGTDADDKPFTAKIGANSTLTFAGDDNLDVLTSKDGKGNTSVAFTLKNDVNLSLRELKIGDMIIDEKGLKFFGAASSSAGTPSPLVTLDKNGLLINGGPSLTKGGIDAGGKAIKQVGTGELKENGDNAATTGQLYALDKNLDKKKADKTALDTLATKEEMEDFKTKVNESAWTLAGKDKNGKDFTAKIGANSTLTFTGDDNLEVVTGEKKDGGTVAFTLKRDLNLDSATFGDTRIDKKGLNLGDQVTLYTEGLKFFDTASSNADTPSPLVTLDRNGLLINGGPSLTKGGIDAGGKAITNVAKGAFKKGSKEVATAGQLYDRVHELDNKKAEISDFDGLAKDLQELKTKVNESAWTLAGKDKNGKDFTAKIGANSTLTFAGDDNLDVLTSKDGKGNSSVAFTLKRDLNLDSATFGDTRIDKKGLNLGDQVTLYTEGLKFFDTASSNADTPSPLVTLDRNGLLINGGPSLTKGGIDAGGKAITNVAEGALEEGSKEAATSGQLYTLDKNLDKKADKTDLLATKKEVEDFKTKVNESAWTLAGTDADDKPFTAKIGANSTLTFAGDKNLEVVTGEEKDGGTVAFALKRDLNLDSATFGNTVIDKKGLNLGDQVTLDTEGLKFFDAASSNVGTPSPLVTLDKNGLLINGGGPSLTKGGIDAGGKAITQVGTGELKENGDNAATTGQLYTLDKNLDKKADKTDLLATKKEVEDFKTKVNESAWTLAGTDADDKPFTAKIGANSTLTFAGDKNLEVVTGEEKDGGTVAFALKRDLNLDSATFGNTVIDKKGLNLGDQVTLDTEGLKFFDAASSNVGTPSPLVTLDKNGLLINGGPSLTKGGIDAGGKAITQVGTGELKENGDNAATTGQVYALDKNLDKKADKTDLLATKKEVEDFKTKVNESAWTLAGTDADDKPFTAKIGANSTLTFAGDKNLEVVTGEEKDGGTVAFALKRDLNLDSATFGNTVIDKKGLNLGDQVTLDTEGLKFFDAASSNVGTPSPLVTLDKNGLLINGGPSLTKGGIDAGGKAIKQVGTGELKENGDNAATTGQLYTLDKNLDKKADKTDLLATKKEVEDFKTKVKESAWTLAGKDKNGKDFTAKIGANSTLTFAGDDNLDVLTSKDGKGNSSVAFTLKRDLNLDSATFGDTRIDKKGLNLGDQVTLYTEGLKFFDTASSNADTPSPLVTLDRNGLLINGGPSLTKGGIDAGGKAITNVAEGALEEGSKEAATSGQLYTLDKNLDKKADKTDLLATKKEVEDFKTKVNESAWTLAGTDADDKPFTAKIGANSTLTFAGDKNLEVVTGEEKDGGTVAFALKRDLNLDSATFGNTVIDKKGLNLGDQVTLDTEGLKFFDAASSNVGTPSPLVTLDKNGLLINGGGPSLTKGGIDAGGKAITNVAEGALEEGSKEAATSGQLYALDKNLDKKADKTDLLATKKEVEDFKTKVNESAWTLAGTDADDKPFTAKIGANSTLTFAGDKNLEVVTGEEKDGGTVAFALKRDLNLDSATFGNTVIDKKGLNLGDQVTLDTEGLKFFDAASSNVGTPSPLVTLDKNGLLINGGGPSLTKGGIDAGGKAITQVGTGELKENGDNAATTGQVYALDKNLDKKADKTDLLATKKEVEDFKTKVNESAWTLAGTDADDKPFTAKIGANSTLTFAGDKNLEVVTGEEKDGGTVAFALKRDLNLDSATFGNTVIDKKGLNLGDQVTLDTEGLKFFDAASSNVGTPSPLVTLDKNGLLINGGPSLTKGGIDAGGKAITQVGTGELKENGDNAATTGQLYTLDKNLDKKADKTDLLATKKEVEDFKTKVNESAWTLAGTDADDKPFTAKIGANSTLTFAGDKNLEVVTGEEKDGGTVAFALKRDLNLDSATFGNTVIDKKGLNLGDQVTLDTEGLKFFDAASSNADTPSPLVTLDRNGLLINGGPSLTKGGIDAGGKAITNVAEGALEEGSKEAATSGQLYTLDKNLDKKADKTDLLATKKEVEDFKTKVNESAWTLAGTDADDKPFTAKIGANSTLTFAGDKNLEVVTGEEKDGGTVAFALKRDLNLDSATFGNTVIDKKGLNLGDQVTLDTEGLKFFDAASSNVGTPSPLVTLDKNGLLINGGPSLTKGGIDAGGKAIKQVGTGELKENGDNAATTGQLYTLDKNLDKKADKTDLLATKKEVEDFKTKVKESAWTLAGKDKNGKDFTAKIGANSTLTFAGDDNLDVLTSKDGKGNSSVAFTLKRDLNLDSATFGDTRIDKKGLNLGDQVTLYTEGLKFFDTASSNADTPSPLVTLDRNGLLINGGPSLTKGGIDAGGKAITNVAEGALEEGSKEVATAGQVFTVQKNLEDLQIKMAEKLKETTQKEIFNTPQLASDDNIRIDEKTDPDLVSFSLNPDLNLDSATFGDTSIDKKGLRMGKEEVILDTEGLKFFGAASSNADTLSPLVTLNSNGLFINGGPSLTASGIDAGDKAITQVGTGELKENGDNAATTGQLFNVNERLKNIEENFYDDSIIPKVAKSYSEKSKTDPPQKSLGSPKPREEHLSLATSGDSWDGKGKRLSNIGEGKVEENSTDVVTGAQLFHVREDLQEKFDKNLNTMAKRIDDLDTRARAGISSALASAALPQANLAGESVISAATANYRGEQALSIGASTVSPNGKWIVKGTANVNREDASAALGIGYRF